VLNVRAALLVIAGLLLGASVQSKDLLAKDLPDTGSDSAYPKIAPEKGDPRSAPPMTFFVAKGEPNACGTGCSAWIAAEGRIDGGTPARLRNLLARTGKRKLPIYFYSPGGSVLPAIEMGHLLRAREMSAGVARTVPQGCDPLQRAEPACEKLKRSGAELTAQLRTLNASCSSACVYALIGAKDREVAPDAAVGIHGVAIVRRLIRTYRSGRVETGPTSMTSDPASMRAINRQLARYAVEMGISAALIDVAASIPHEDIRFITRDEIARFGIDTRESDESRWVLYQFRSGTWAVLKSVIRAKGADKPGEPKRYRTLQFMILCGRPGFVRVGIAGTIDPLDAPTSSSIRSSGSEIALVRTRMQPKAGDAAAGNEIRFAAAQRSFFESATSLDLVETVWSVPKTPRRVTLSTLGLPAAMEALAQHCQ